VDDGNAASVAVIRRDVLRPKHRRDCPIWAWMVAALDDYPRHVVLVSAVRNGARKHLFPADGPGNGLTDDPIHGCPERE